MGSTTLLPTNLLHWNYHSRENLESVIYNLSTSELLLDAGRMLGGTAGQLSISG